MGQWLCKLEGRRRRLEGTQTINNVNRRKQCVKQTTLRHTLWSSMRLTRKNKPNLQRSGVKKTGKSPESMGLNTIGGR
jgi:hypothetical protein